MFVKMTVRNTIFTLASTKCYRPATGGPYTPAIPLARVRSPNALVNFLRPSKSQMMMDVNEM